jgi:hypothetical protein
MEAHDFPPQVLLRNIPTGYDHLFVMATISGMMEEGYPKGLVAPTRTIVRTDHAFLHFDDAHDAVQAQKHLNKYKFNHAILSAHLLMDERMVTDQVLPLTAIKATSDKDFVPMPSQENKENKEIKENKENRENKKSEGPQHFNILNSIMKGLEGCDDFLEEKPVEVKKVVRPVNNFCVECGFKRPHTIQECPSLRHKTRNFKCSYCLGMGHILFAKYPGVKELICPVAIARGGAFKY